MTTRPAARLLPRHVLPALLLASCASPGAPEALPVAPVAEVAAVRAADTLLVDGRDADAAWALAPETTVPLEGVAGPSSCTVKAAVHRGTLFLLVRWEDPTEDRSHKPWVRGADGKWTTGPEREDVLSVAFPMEGEFTANMLSPVDAVWDAWYWKSARTDPAGHAMDKVHRMSLKDPGGSRTEHALPDGVKVHIARPEDAGTSATEELPAPAADAASPAPRYRARTPSGSAGSVLARGTWRDGRWTVEIARALRTGEPDDRDLHGLASIPFALAVLDRAEDEAHAVSGVLRLHLGADAAGEAGPVTVEGFSRDPRLR